MGKMHISLPDDLHAALDATCEKFNLSRPKLMQRGIRLAIGEAERIATRPLIAINELKAPPASIVQASAQASAKVRAEDDLGIEAILRGTSVWFDLPGLLKALSVEPADFMQQIDEEDDILEYSGKQWVTDHGFSEAKTLCRDHRLVDRVQAWATTKQLTLQTPAT